MKKLLLIALAAVLAVAFCAPAMAAEKKVTFYGDYRFNTYWVQKSEELYNNGLGDKDSDLLFDPDEYDSRFGARFSEGALSANVEFRPLSASYFRQWWGQYDFGAVQLLIGHTYTPACVAFDMSQFDDESGVSYGDLMSRLRTNQIRISVPFAMGKFVIAAQNNPMTMPEFTSTPTFPTDTDMSLPEFEGCLTLNVGPAVIDLFGGWASYDLVDKSTENSASVDSNLYGIKVKVPFGPMYFTAEYYGATNPNNYGELTSGGGLVPLQYSSMLLDPVTGQSTDAKLKGYGALLGYRLSDMVTAELGYFTQKVERYLQEEDDNGTYYLVCAITPVKGLTIYPEIGVRDEKKIVNASGVETKRVLESTGGPDYKQLLGKELAEIRDSEMWRAGKATRDLRPREEAKTITDATKGVAGRQSN